MDVDIIIKSLLIFVNKDRYADIRLLFKYIFENKYIEREYSKIIPRYTTKEEPLFPPYILLMKSKQLTPRKNST